LIATKDAIAPNELENLKRQLGILSDNIAVYTGGLYSLKRIPFLIESAVRIRKLLPDFHLLVIGDGPERPLVTAAARDCPWIHDLGPKNDTEKVPYWAISKLLLMPGGVGLVVLDSFALGVPMVTTDTHLHGPEIEYLASGVNGLLVPCGDDLGVYAESVVVLLKDEARLAAMREAAIEAAGRHTIEQMAANFADGVMKALALPR
jgi:glycosyltransferase involved in cell wall biosynthesis